MRALVPARTRVRVRPGALARWRARGPAYTRAMLFLTKCRKCAKIGFSELMGRKFTSEDMFRIARNNLSDVEWFEFRFACTTATFREVLTEGSDTTVFDRLGVDITNDEEDVFSLPYAHESFPDVPNHAISPVCPGLL